MDFPHLTDSTSFPHIGNVNTYRQYENTYDYDRWTAETTLQPCNVRWTLESDDRPYWQTETERNNYFTNMGGRTYTLTSAMDITPEDTVKLPIPYQAMQKANYLHVVTPALPGDGDTLDYGETEPQHYFYFVRSAHYLAPNTTECQLILDDWTTWIYAMELPRINVERGHIGMSYTTVDDYLNDPLNHTRGLTASEPGQPTSPVKTTKNQFVPLGSGQLYAVIAFRCSPTQASHITAIEPGEDTDATYSDYGTYDGDDYTVNDYEWGQLPNLNSQTSRLTSGYTADNIRPNGYGIAACLASNLETFLDNVNTNYQTLWGLIECVYIVPSDMLRLGTTSLTIGGVTFYRAYSPTDTTLADLSLSKSDFGYSDEYADIAKLYTSPYAWLVINDGNGNEVTVEIENTTSDLAVYRRVSLIYPYLQAQTFLTGISGSGNTSYTWRNMADSTVTSTIPDSGIYHALMTHDIPTYALMADSAAVWNVSNHSSSIYAARQNAINSYHIATRSANTAQYNTEQSNATNVTNTAATNSTNVSNTNRSNTAITNNASENNSATSYNMNIQIGNMQGSVEAQNGYIDTMYNNDGIHLAEIKGAANTLLTKNYEANMDSASSMVVNDIGSTLAGAALSIGGGIAASVASGGSLAPAAIGAASGTLSALSGTASATYTYQVGTTTSTEQYEAQQEYNNATYDYKRQQVEAANTVTKLQNTTMNDYQCNTIRSTTNRNIEANTTTTANTVNASNSNASASASTSNSNANRSADTSNANASRSRHASVLSAQTSLTQAQRNYQATIRDLNRSRSSDIATPSGDPLMDLYGTRGVQVRVMTQNDDVTRRMGDMFLRYGYTLNENVESPDLNIMRNFTYWQGEPVIYGECPTNSVTEVRRLFENGVTVWRDPDKIGSSIYDNI